MSNDKKHGDDALSLDLDDNMNADDSSMDDGERSDDSDSKQEDDSDDEVTTDNLDLEPDKDKKDTSKKEEVVEQHARSWAARIISRKATLDSIPANHQYLKPRIKELLGIKPDAPQKELKSKSHNEVMAIVRFETLKGQVKKSNRTPEQTRSLNEEFKELVSKGYEPDVALQKAIKLAGVDLEESADQPQIRMGGKPADVEAEPKFTGNEDTNKMSRKGLAKFIKAQPHRR